MVRGRRARVADTTTATTNTIPRMTNGTSHLVVDDQYCASPKRKDCKIDDVPQNLKAAIEVMNTNLAARPIRAPSKTATNEISSYQIFGGAKTRSQTAIRQYFRETKTRCPAKQNFINDDNEDGDDDDDDDDNDDGNDIDDMQHSSQEEQFYANGNSIGAELEIQMTATNSPTLDITEDTCDGLPDCVLSSAKQSSNMADNIFLQAPVLSLNVDKSPNQASSIKINKTLEVEPIFAAGNGGYHHQLNGQFNKIVSLRSASLESNSPILLNTDSNSCDSGVVVDNKLELSPSRRRKPTTPHRILCPSPVKHAIVEKSPANALSHVNGLASGNSAPVGAHYSNAIQKRNPKSRRRLNANQSENQSSIGSPQIVGGVTLTTEALNQKCCNGTNRILNSAKNPTAEQNTNNNFKLAQQQKHRHNGQHSSSNSNYRSQQVPVVDNNRKVTDFFPVRRSVRKTKKAVQEEMMRSIEKAIIEGREDGLRIENFEEKGRGVVADRSFKRGEYVVEYIGELIAMGEANERETKYSLDENAGCYMYYFKHRNQQYCIDATAETGKLGRLVNHSRNGNLQTKVVVLKGHPHLVLVAKDDIEAGEEVTYDYGDRSKESLQHHPWLAF